MSQAKHEPKLTMGHKLDKHKPTSNQAKLLVFLHFWVSQPHKSSKFIATIWHETILLIFYLIPNGPYVHEIIHFMTKEKGSLE